MGKKMYYTEQEAAQRLGITEADLAKHVRDAKLRVFQDGARKMFRVDEVDKLAAESGEVELSPAADAVRLDEAEAAHPPTKEDTVITAEGISIFDDEDLEIESADPMAKTQIAPSVEDQISLEGVGSGSGLLDLTRESDDTSLGAEVLDHIGEEGAGAGPPATAAPAASFAGVAPVAEPIAIVTTEAEVLDAGSGPFGGIIVACAVVAALLAAAAMSIFTSEPPGYLEQIQANLAIVVGACVVIVLVGAVLGWLAGRSADARRAAMRQAGAPS